MSGGIRVVYEYSNRLIDLGHQVTLVSAQSDDTETKHMKLFSWLLSFIARINPSLFEVSIDYYKIKAKLFRVPDLSEAYIPDSDVIIATAWQTAEWVNSYSLRKGRKFYLIQGYETWNGPEERVKSTYKMPLEKIVVSTYLKDLLKLIGEKCHGPIISGVNFDLFFNKDKRYNEHKRIGMLYHNSLIKGIPDGIKAFEIAKRAHPDIELVMFSTKKKGQNVPEYAEYHQNPSQDKLREIYCSLDLFLWPSLNEGGSLPPMEAMACKCAVVATNVGAIPDFIIPDKTALVSPPNHPEILARNIIRFIEDGHLLKRISIEGYNNIQEFTWDKAVNEFNKILVGH
jgi:hypothetical protein